MRPQARVFGILIEGANVRCFARPGVLHSLNRTPLRSKPCLISGPPKAYASRFYATGKEDSSSRRSSIIEDRVLAEELGKASRVITTTEVPEESAVQSSLDICLNLAKSLYEPIKPLPATSKPPKSPTSNLLFLEESKRPPKQLPQQNPPATIPKGLANKISMTASKIIIDPNVFITPALLATYVQTQCILGRPETFPEVFALYASKPMPQRGTSPIKYEKANPKSLPSAVPLVLAHDALTAAIDIKDLSLCMSIIDASVAAPAFKRNRAFRKALFPVTALALAPAAAYVLSSRLAELQHSMDSAMATQLLSVALVAYIGFTGVIGFVAVTTSNDQMDRITWRKGTPLSERWLREDERALVDRVAGAWGFQAISMRGEEDSAEWEALREWAGGRGMILDSPELMDGME